MLSYFSLNLRNKLVTLDAFLPLFEPKESIKTANASTSSGSFKNKMEMLKFMMNKMEMLKFLMKSLEESDSDEIEEDSQANSEAFVNLVLALFGHDSIIDLDEVPALDGL